MPTSDCVVFLTHQWGRHTAGHYERLQRELSGLVDVRLAYHRSTADAPVPSQHDPVVVTTPEVIDAFPLRVAAHGDSWIFECCELIWLTACLKPELAAYQRFWVIEFDVDFAGDWSEFFEKAIGYEGDLLGVDLRPLSHEPDWWNVGGFSRPADVAIEPILGFFPIVRASRGLLEHYRSGMAQPGWTGHFEAVLPSFAAANGYAVREIGGSGPYTPDERRGLHYTTRRMDGRAATFDYRPLRGTAYFEQNRRAFRRPGMLYHPVKADLPRREVRRFYLTQGWLRFRDTLLGRS